VGPLRASASVILSLKDGRHRQPKAALEEFCSEERWRESLEELSAMRQGQSLRPGAVRQLFGDVMKILENLDAAAHGLS
jgi:hypothetical protein